MLQLSGDQWRLAGGDLVTMSPRAADVAAELGVDVIPQDLGQRISPEGRRILSAISHGNAPVAVDPTSIEAMAGALPASP